MIAAAAAMLDYRIFEAGDVVLQSGLTYRGARLAYKTYGTLDAAKSNVIVYPTSYGAQHYDLEWAIGRGQSARSDEIFHRHHEQVRQRAFVLAEQYAAAVRPRALSAFHNGRQCPRPAAAVAGGLWH